MKNEDSQKQKNSNIEMKKISNQSEMLANRGPVSRLASLARNDVGISRRIDVRGLMVFRFMGGRGWTLIVLWLILGQAVFWAAGCKKNNAVAQEQPVEPPAVPVLAGQSEQKTMPLQYRTFGTVKASATVDVKSQVLGELMTIHFAEGQIVQKGDLLFTIDPKPYQVVLSQAQANLSQAEAHAENARREEARAANLLKDKVMPQEQYDQRQTTKVVAEAAVQVAQSAVQDAELKLGYCTIASPMTGRTGSLLVDRGNLIKINDIAMVTIHQIKPIYVVFAVPQNQLPQIRRNFTAGQKMSVEVNPPTQPDLISRGELTLIENQVDRETGTVKMRGTFTNADDRLWPGEFVEATLTIELEPDVVVIPSQAVQFRQAGPYVFVIKADQTVEDRTVEVGRTVGAETVILSNLQAGEKVVTDGHLRLVRGSRVVIKPGLPSPEMEAHKESQKEQ
jgi:membrane fusion protein, multidrug efflux system